MISSVNFPASHFSHRDLNEWPNYNNSIDCIVPTCSGVGMCETVVYAAQNCTHITHRTSTNINGTCSFIVGYTGGFVQIRVEINANHNENKNENENRPDESKKTSFSIYEMYRNNWKELTRTMIAMLGPDLAYGLFCFGFIAAFVLDMLTVPWMVLALCGYRYTLHLNLVGLKVRRKKDGKVVYGTMGRNRFGMDFLRGRFGLLVMSNLLVKSQAYVKMPDGCKGKGLDVRTCYPRQAVDELDADGSGTHPTYGPMKDWDMSLVTDLSSLFSGMYLLTADLSNWDVSRVTTMKEST